MTQSGGKVCRQILWFGLAALVICSPLVGCPGGDDEQSLLQADVSVDFEENEWPVYAGKCFLFQAPPKLDVHRHRYGHKILDLSFIVYERSQNQDETLLVLEPGQSSFSDSADEGVKMRVGGMDAKFYQERDDRGHYSGNFIVDLPRMYPHTVQGTFRDLDVAQRDIVFRIFTSLRFELIQHNIDGVSVDADFGSKMVLDPVTYSPAPGEDIRFCSV